MRVPKNEDQLINLVAIASQEKPQAVDLLSVKKTTAASGDLVCVPGVGQVNGVLAIICVGNHIITEVLQQVHVNDTVSVV